MSKYTPTTEVVCAAYIDDSQNSSSKFIDSDLLKAEFDRWLAQHDAEVARATEERIIKLLEAESLCKGTEHDYNGSCYCDTIALIKGENK